MIAISVIVPVYKVENRLHYCIESILAQSFKDFELILIDDGSPDHSGEICDEYARKDKRIRVFHQQNAGVSAARNRGLDEAEGKYIVFVDSDDWVLPQYLEELYSMQITQPEGGLVIQSMLRVTTEGGSLPSHSLPDCSFSFSEIGKAFVENNICEMGYPWAKIYTRNIINKFSIRFDETIHCLEDLLFMYQYLLHCDSLVLSPVRNYVYVRYPSSLSNRIHSFESEYNCFMLYQALLSKMIEVWKISVDEHKVIINSLLVPFRRALKSDYQSGNMVSRTIRIEHMKRMILENRKVLSKFYHPVFKTDKLGKILLFSNCFALYDFYISLLFRMDIGPVFYGPKHIC